MAEGLVVVVGHSNADRKDFSDKAVCGSDMLDRFAETPSFRHNDTTDGFTFAPSMSNGFLTSFATLMITSNFVASSSDGSK